MTMRYDKEQLLKVLTTSFAEFNTTEFQAMDANLPPEQKEEWDAIYASFESGSILHGTIIGIERIELPAGVEVEDNDEGALDAENAANYLTCLVIMKCCAKVLLPVPLFWRGRQARIKPVGVIGADVDYIIIGVNREGSCAMASRLMALNRQRWYAREVKKLKAGDIVTANVLAVGPSRLTVTVCGYDISLAPPALSYHFLPDLRTVYTVGQNLDTKIMDISDDLLVISMREIAPDPYLTADKMHPVDSSRIAVITNKYHGGVFCRLTDGCTVICKYAQQFADDQFQVGDRVLVQIRSFDEEHHWLRGKIKSKL